jgi:hypothetical protein
VVTKVKDAMTHSMRLCFSKANTQRAHSAWTLYRKTQELADKEGRIPVIGLQEFRKKGILLVIHSDDLQRVAEEARKAANPKRKRPLRTEV